MDDSDGEYVDDQIDGPSPGSPGSASQAAARPPQGTRRARRQQDGGGTKAAWEEIQRSWEQVVEGADGAVEIDNLLEVEKRRRLLRDTTPLQRGIIRHQVLVLDMSFAMADKDLLPSRYKLTLTYAIDYVREYFEQNPISQLGVVAMRDGIAVRVSDMSGNPADHTERLQVWHAEHEPSGNPSLQNALEMCRAALFHAPSHGTREVLIIYGALLSSDPSDIQDTITALIADRIRVSIVGLAAQVALCAELCVRTNDGDDSQYTIALHEQHFRTLFLAATTPPVMRSREQSKASLLMMGFPSRVLAAKDTLALCACHNAPGPETYACTRCHTKVCRLPIECPSCGLTLILSTHLARSYHHLFPLRNWVEVSWAEAEAACSTACYSCLTPFPGVAKAKAKAKSRAPTQQDFGPKATEAAGSVVKAPMPKSKGVSESGRYACQVCWKHFCIDCDVFAHEVVHNCPGCQSDSRERPAEGGQGSAAAVAANGTGHANGAGS